MAFDGVPLTARQVDTLPAMVRATGTDHEATSLTSGGMPDTIALPQRPEPGPELPPSTTVIDTQDRDWLDYMPDWLVWPFTHGAMLLVPFGAVLALILGVLLWRRVRRSSVAQVGRTIAGPMVLAWEAQGVYQLARAIGIPAAAAGVLAFVTSAVLITFAAQADEHHHRHGTLGPSGRLIWIVAVPMGLVVALSAHSAAEVALRIILPMLAGLVFMSRYLPDEPPDAERTRRQGGFRYTPRRIAVRWGLFEATDADIETVNRDRLVRQMTDLEAARRGTSWSWLKARRAARLRKLSLFADPAIIAAVKANVAQASWFETDQGDIAPFADPGGMPASVSTLVPIPAAGGRAGNMPTHSTGINPDIRAGIEAGNARAAERASARARRASPAQVKARKLKAQNPDITWMQLAQKVGANERTVRRWFEQETQPLPVSAPVPAVTAGVNGHAFQPSPPTPKEPS